MKKNFLAIFSAFCLLAALLSPFPVMAQPASAPEQVDHAQGFVWLSGGSGSSANNSSYGRNYRDLSNPANIARLDLRYFNDKAIEYHAGGYDLGSLNSRIFGVLYLQDRFKLDFEGGRITHTTSHSEEIKTQRDWLEFSALQDVSPFLTFGLSGEGYDRGGSTRFNPIGMSYKQLGLSLNYLRGPVSAMAFYRRGEFEHSLYGYEDRDYGMTLGRRFRSGRDHAVVSYERNNLHNDAQSALELDRRFFSAVYSSTPNKDWTFRGAFRSNDTDNETPSIFGEDFSERSASLDVIYHGFKNIRAKGRLTTHDADRRVRSGRNLLHDTKDVTSEIRLADKGKCDWKWDFRYKYTDRDGGIFTHLDPIGHARVNALNYMDYFPGNSYKRAQTTLALSRGFDKDKLLFSFNLLRDRTEYSRSPGVGINNMQYDNAMANLVWFANSRLTLGLGGGITETEMNAATNVRYQFFERPFTADYDGWDKVINFNLGYTLNSRTVFSADLLTTQSNSDGLMNPNRFREFEQRYELEYRLSKAARLGLRFTDVRYAERIYALENGRIRRIDVDYRILF